MSFTANALRVVSLSLLALLCHSLGAASTAAPAGSEKKEKTAVPRQVPPSLPSLPALKAVGPLRILIVDDDWSDNNAPDGNQRLSGSDQIFRALVAAAVGGNAASWSVEIAPTYKDGPAFERLRDYNVVLWYTGGSYGGGYDNAATLSIEDEKTARRYLQETGGSFILISPGYVNNLSYSSTWSGSSHPFLKEVAGINGFSGYVQRFAAGKVQAHDGSTFSVEQKGAAEPQFSAVNSDGAAIVFTATLDPLKTAAGPVPVATAYPYGGGRFVYVGFTFENIPEAERAQAFKILLGAAGAPQGSPATSAGPILAPDTPGLSTSYPVRTSLPGAGLERLPAPVAPTASAPPAGSSRPGERQRTTHPFTLLRTERVSVGVGVGEPGPIEVQVESKGGRIAVALISPDGRTIERTGTGSLTVTGAAGPMANRSAEIWTVRLREASDAKPVPAPPHGVPPPCATGTITIVSPTVSPEALRTASEHRREQSAQRAATAVAAPLNTTTMLIPLQQKLDRETAARQGAQMRQIAPRLPAEVVTLATQRIASRAKGEATPAPALPYLPVTLLTNTYTPPSVLQITALSVSEGDPGTSVVLEGSGFGDYKGSVHFMVAGDRDLVAPVLYWTPTRIAVEVPAVSGVTACDGAVYVKKTDGAISPQRPFRFLPTLVLRSIGLPAASDMRIGDGENLGNRIRHSTVLLTLFGGAGFDEFYVSGTLQNGWVVESASVTHLYGYGGTYVREFRPGTASPYVKVRWWCEVLDAVSYNISVVVKGPKGVPHF